MSKHHQHALVAAMLVMPLILGACSKSPEPANPPAAQPAPQAEPQKSAISISKWGPQFATLGQPFNKQPNGMSSLWFKQNGISDRKLVEVRIGNHVFTNVTVTPNEAMSVSIDHDVFSEPGKYPVTIADKRSGSLYEVGFFILRQSSDQ